MKELQIEVKSIILIPLSLNYSFIIKFILLVAILIYVLKIFSKSEKRIQTLYISSSLLKTTLRIFGLKTWLHFGYRVANHKYLVFSRK